MLEPYFDSLELRIREGDQIETVRCVAGAFALPRVDAAPQFAGAIGRIECLESGGNPALADGTLEVRWRT